MPKPARKPAKPEKGRRLTPAEWLRAREEWEADERLSASFIAEKYGTTWRAVKERITTERWIRRIHKQLVHVPRPRPPWRPTLFREEFGKMLLDYFRRPAFKYEGADPENGIPGVISEAYPFPMLEEFAESIGVHRQRLHEWATATDAQGNLRYPDFADAYARAKQIQEIVLVRGGVHGHYNSLFASLAARNILGWRNEVEPEEKPDDQYPDRAVLDRIYAEGMERKRLMAEKVAERQGRFTAAGAAPSDQQSTGAHPRPPNRSNANTSEEPL